MPYRDGTGPRGDGPMTGKGNGYCVLKIPETPGEPLVGFAGSAGTPVSIPAVSPSTDTLSLHVRMWRVHCLIQEMRRRLSLLDSTDTRITSRTAAAAADNR